MSCFRSLRRHASTALAVFVATLVVTLVTPWMQASAHDGPSLADICSVTKHDGARPVDSTPPDHAAHCPLCLPAAAPPPFVAWTAAGEARDAPIAAVTANDARASSVGAPLPPRGPPASV